MCTAVDGMSGIELALDGMKDALHAIATRSQQEISHQVQLQNNVSSLKNNMSDLQQKILSQINEIMKFLRDLQRN